MKIGTVLNIIGKLLVMVSLMLLTPIPFSLYYGEGMVLLFSGCALLGLLLGGALAILFVADQELGYKDGFAIVAFSWLTIALLGALPYYLSGVIPLFVDALFESMSGFTTTGSTILVDIEALPKCFLFWRTMTHWLGGMGIIVLTLAILPMLGIGGMQVFQAEVPGPTKDRLSPRIQDTARILWTVYLLLTGVATVLFMFGGMDFFNALTHAFSTLASGGFANHNDSMARYQSDYLQAVLVLFMFIAGVNFSLHYAALFGKPLAYWKNEEFRAYCYLVLGAIGLLYFSVHFSPGAEQYTTPTLQEIIFQVVSIITTTGFGTADFTSWPPFCHILMISLMLVGGCAGSTSGSIKVVRFILFFKCATLQITKLIHPHQVKTIKLGKTPVDQNVMIGILGFFGIYLIVFFSASLLITAMGVDLVTGPTAVIATLNNIGPGLGAVGPASNFSSLPPLAKLVLTFCMLAGRLELYTLAILFTPGYWKMARRPVFFWEQRQQKRIPLTTKKRKN